MSFSRESTHTCTHTHTHTRIKQERLANHDGAVQLYGGYCLDIIAILVQLQFRGRSTACVGWSAWVSPHTFWAMSVLHRPASGSLTVWAIVGHSGSSASLRVTDSLGDSWASSEPWMYHDFRVLVLGLGVASVGHESQEQCVALNTKSEMDTSSKHQSRVASINRVELQSNGTSGNIEL